MIEVRLRFCAEGRKRFTVPNEARAKALRAMAKALTSAEIDPAEAEKLLDLAAECDDRRFAFYQKEVADSTGVPVPEEKAAGGKTFRELAEAWTSGELQRDWPDYVKAKRSVDGDVCRLEKLYETIGPVPLVRFELADAERAMAALGSKLTGATRRQYAQLISKVLKLAVYPCKLIERSPLPSGFLPKSNSSKAHSYLYPAEEAQLLKCEKIALGRRVLYGFIAREGMRIGEANGLRWRDVDLERGTVTLDVNKTDDPRSWVLSPGVKEALKAWKPEGAQANAAVFPDDGLRRAETFRADLELAEIKRAELFENSKTRQPIRFHDLRSTFITLALANGRSESWVADRTGHRSSVMINRYRRASRTAAELNLGTLAPLHRTLPEIAKLLTAGGPKRGPERHAWRPMGQRRASNTPRKPRIAFRRAGSGSLFNPLVQGSNPCRPTEGCVDAESPKPYAIHTAYWGNLQGGACIDVSPIDGKWLFEFREPALPTGWHALRWRTGARCA